MDVTPGRNRADLARTGPIALGRRGCLTRNRKPRSRPGAKAAVEHTYRWVTEILQEPEGPRRANSRVLVVHDDRPRRVDTVNREHVLDHPHERVERSGIRVDEAHS